MSFNLKSEIEKLSNTAPVLKDYDEAYSDDETRAKLDSVPNEFEDELDPGVSTRRIRAPIADLSEYGVRYKGKRVSRKDLEEFELENNNETDEDIEDDDENESEEEEENENDDDDDEEEEEDQDEYDEEDQEADTTNRAQPKAAKKQEKSDDGIDVIRLNHKAEVEKGQAVKNQLNLWDLLLDTRIKMQGTLNTVNQFPQHDRFDQITKRLKGNEPNEALKTENQSLLVKAVNQLAELQQRLVINDPELSALVKELELETGAANGDDENATKASEKRESSARKRKKSDSEAQDEDESQEESSDEEIYSDTDEEMRAQEVKRAKKSQQAAKFSFTVLKQDQFEDYLAKFHREYQRYRNATIQKWYDKTRLSTGKSFSALEKPILQQIEQVLMDKERIIRRTQLKRSMLSILGKEEGGDEEDKRGDDEAGGLRDRHLKDYDQEIFDDQDFYNQLVRELIDRRSANVADPVELARKSIELNRLRASSKKKVDTKASKGRKIRFNVHKPLVNFMAPIFRGSMPEETRNELFKSLFGNQIGSSSNGHTSTQDMDFSSIFKGFN